jgi:hypothetical protein
MRIRWASSMPVIVTTAFVNDLNPAIEAHCALSRDGPARRCC